MNRNVKFECVKKSPIGEWKLICKTCPLLQHLLALGMEARPCMAGMTTNIQGIIVLKKCEHYVEDSFDKIGKIVTVKCKKENA